MIKILVTSKVRDEIVRRIGEEVPEGDPLYTAGRAVDELVRIINSENKDPDIRVKWGKMRDWKDDGDMRMIVKMKTEI